MSPGTMALIIGAGVVVLALVWVVVNFNRFAALNQHIRESWSDVDVELKRRYELIPNLVETVKGYAAHERTVLEELTALRNRALANQGPPGIAESIAWHPARAADETAMLLGLRKLFAVVESYPDLKADRHFLALQQELALTEDRIAAARRFYNANVREINQLCRSFPTNILASAFGFRGGEFFELASDAERLVPRSNV